MESTIHSPQIPILLLNGLSGAGKSTALHVFNDLNFYVVDGLPAALALQILPALLTEASIKHKGLAICFEIKTQEAVNAFVNNALSLRTQYPTLNLLYLEASTEALLNRYTITRRPHPLEIEDLGLEQAIFAESKLLSPIREIVDFIIDTTKFSIHDLRRYIQKKWTDALHQTSAMRINLVSFGFKYGIPSDVDMMFDLRFLPNPYFIESLQPLTGLEPAVSCYVLSNPQGSEFFKHLSDFLLYVIPQFEAEGRYRLTIGIGCTGGKHRSVAITEALAKLLRSRNYSPTKTHKHLNLE